MYLSSTALSCYIGHYGPGPEREKRREEENEGDLKVK